MIDRPARQPAHAEEPIVFVVDDDESMREALRSLLRSVKLRVETFGSAADLLRSKLPDVASCLVLDVRLPGLSGLDFQAELAKANIRIPIIFMTGYGDIPMSASSVDTSSTISRQRSIVGERQRALAIAERDRPAVRSHYSTPHRQRGFAAGAPRQRPAHGPGTRGARYQSDAPHTGFAMVILARSVGRGCPWLAPAT